MNKTRLQHLVEILTESTLQETGHVDDISKLSHYTWEMKSSNRFGTEYHFDTDPPISTPYVVDIFPKEKEEDTAIVVSFDTRSEKEKDSNQLTNRGEIYRVMNTVMDILKDYLDRSSNDIERIYFYPSVRVGKDNPKNAEQNARTTIYKQYILDPTNFPKAKVQANRDEVIVILNNDYSSMKENKHKDQLLSSVERDQVEMIDGIVEIVRKVKDMDNRKKIANDMLKDFKKEDISVDKYMFLAACGLKESSFSIKSFDEFLLESEQQKLHFYIDMDGVLADFDGEVRDSKTGEAFEEALQNLRDWMKKNHPEIKWRIPHDLKAMAQEDPKLKALYQEVSNNVMKEATKKDFFVNLKVLDGAREILKTAKELSGKLPDILTACVSSPHCEPEKAVWMKKHFDGMYDKIYYEQDKEKYAKSKYKVLIDDRSRNIKKFVDAGGSGINHYEEDIKRTLDKMKEIAQKG